ncbi:4-diphosphocytidyl-2C-methyl-D-erythritol kinase [Mytilinidion resinicola]|uniref:4-(cytidine 5'-diphospho)-2-C-methyl-D-erythritol kinase n=1 Tax=Mytilinidion resinicola TaxID=574789 RepID=A0A6A6Z278_9PEZI|nr:4-diphosphocytidyl-2C-methyl-D-erythritol kinase [Mytilinidion resinicola]KAF2814394.1 4-diphosphocytidyl-2C-methyl-D-erythritol kinase [Mytilinidion resinicola]
MASSSLELECVILRAPAKLNIYLQAGQSREDGYHDIMTRLGEHVGIKPNQHFELIKAIPTEAGLGGGSADAAAAIVGCNTQWQLGLGEDDLAAIGAQVGEDAPFFIKGMMAVGIGHRQPLQELKASTWTWHWVLGMPKASLATKHVFAQFDALADGCFDEVQYKEKHATCLQIPWASAPPHELAGLLRNDLEPAAAVLLPEIRSAIDAGQEKGALASIMTGSGSTCAFLARDEDHGGSLAVALRETGLFRKVITTTGPVSGIEL